MRPSQQRVSWLVTATLLGAAAGAAACSAVLGLDAPTLDPCASGTCTDGSVLVDASPVTTGGDSASPSDAATERDSAATDAQSPSDAGEAFDGNGVRCGPLAGATGCDPPSVCCLVVEAGVGSYTCQPSTGACPGYPISCATNDDCAGNDVCCFYQTGMKCEPENTSSCTNELVCDPADPSDTCNTGQLCDIAYVLSGGYTLPYYGCN